MRKTFLLLLALLAASPAFGATSFPISGGSLVNDLSGNGFKLQNIGTLNIGSGAGADSGRINLTGTGTSAASGLWFGSDVNLFRSGATALTITGNVTVAGTITAANLSTTAGDNTWVGSQTFAGPVAFDAQPTFGTGVAAQWRTALGLSTGGDVQPYNASLTALGGLDKSNGNVIIGNGSTWTVRSGATLRTAIGLGATDAVTFTSVTAPTLTLGIGATITSPSTGNLLLTGATTVSGVLTTPAGAVMGGTNVPVVIQDKLLFGPDSGSLDVNLYRSAANVLKTDDAFVAASASFNTPLSVGSGGTGTTPATLGNGKYLYSDGATWASATITDYGRTWLAQSSAYSARSALGLGSAATIDFPASGDAGAAQAVLGNDTRLAVSGVTAATYGSNSTIPVIAVNAYGRITSASSAALGAGSVTLGTTTAGNYVSSISGGTGVTVTGTAAGPWTPTISIGQAVGTTSSPTFSNLTVTGTLTLAGAMATANATFTDLVTSTLSGITNAGFIYVSPSASAATDVRTGLSNYDMFRPFKTTYAAINAASVGDTIVLGKGTYTSVSLPAGLNVLLEAGANAQLQVADGSGTLTDISGWGTVSSTTGNALAIQSATANVTCNAAVYGTVGLNAGTLSLSKPVFASKANATVVTAATGTTLSLLPGSQLFNTAATGTYNAVDALTGSTVKLYGAVPLGGTGISGAGTIVSTYGLAISTRMSFSTATFSAATSWANAVLLGTSTRLYESGGALALSGGLTASNLTLSGSLYSTNYDVTVAQPLTVTGAISATEAAFDTPLPVTSGGTGANDATTARSNLGLPTPAPTGLNSYYSSGSFSNTNGTAYCANTANATYTLPSTTGLPVGMTFLAVQTATLNAGAATTITAASGNSLSASLTNVVLSSTGQAVLFRIADTGVWSVVSHYKPPASTFVAPVVQSTATTAQIDYATDLVLVTSNATVDSTLTLPQWANRTQYKPVTIVQMGALTTGTTTVVPYSSSEHILPSITDKLWMNRTGQSVTVVPTWTSNWAVDKQNDAGPIQDKVVLETYKLDTTTAVDGTIVVDAARTPVVFYSTNATASGTTTINVRGTSTLTLSQFLSGRDATASPNYGQAVTVTVLVNQGASVSNWVDFKIDGTSATVSWAENTVPSNTASSTMMYTFTIFKLGAGSYKVLGSYQFFKP